MTLPTTIDNALDLVCAQIVASIALLILFALIFGTPSLSAAVALVWIASFAGTIYVSHSLVFTRRRLLRRLMLPYPHVT